MSEVVFYKKIEDIYIENVILVYCKSEKREVNRKIVIGEKLFYFNWVWFMFGINVWRCEGG